jgi:hypothetical protein
MKKGKVVAGLTGLMLAGGIAFAAWTATGTGSGYAKAISATALSTVDVSASTTADLYPGNNGGDVLVRFSNPNPYPVMITAISKVVADPIETVSNDTTCEATSGVTFDNATGLTWAVPAAAGATPGEASHTLADGANMSNASVNECQGETFIIPVTFSGQSNA